VSARLDGLVDACLGLAAGRPDAEAAALLRANADRLERRLRALSDWAGGGGERAAALDGLSAFDLADAMDRLNAAARRRERTGAAPRR
jgi:hypothetical protein